MLTIDKLIKGRKYRISFNNKEAHIGIFKEFLYEDDIKKRRMGLFNIMLFKSPFDSYYVEGDWTIQESSETLVAKKMAKELLNLLPKDVVLLIKDFLIEPTDDSFS